MVYTIFNMLTGKIIKTVRCPVDMINLQLRENEDYVEGEYLDTKYFIKNREPLELPNNDKEEAQQRIQYTIPEEEVLIRSKQMELFRQQAIEELKKEGKLPEDYKGVKDAI